MSLLSFHDQKHIAQMLVQEYRVNGIYNRLISDLSLILERWKEGGRSVWVRNREIERLVDKRLREFVEEFKRHIDEETLKAWNLSNLKNDKLIEKFIKNLSISDVLKDGMMQRNRCLRSFQESDHWRNESK